jgi:DNA-binding YbaB/EbfC family protein
MGTGFAKKKKQARDMQEQFGKMQNELKNVEVIGSAGNGLVTITLGGEHDMKQIKIKPDCVDPEDVEGLQDLIKSAYNDASEKLQKESMKNMPKMPGFPAMF